MIKNIELYNENLERVISENPDLEDLKGKSILITGANGLIASCIVDILNWLNENKNYNISIKALVRNKDRLLDRFKTYKNFEVIEQDIVNPINCETKTYYIIHAASNSHPKSFAEDPVGTMLGNFIGMKNVLEYAVKQNVKKVEYISTGEVYGEPDKNIESFKEDYIGKVNPMNARSCYPLSKLASEALCVSYSEQYNIDTVIVRPCHCYGPTQTDKDSRASAQFINNVINGKDIVMKSEGLQIRSYCYVVDCAVGALIALINGKNCNAYNVANNNSRLSIKEMAEKTAKIGNRKVVYEIASKEEKKGYNPVTRSVLDGSKLEKIGWNPVYSFDEGIRETLKIMRKRDKLKGGSLNVRRFKTKSF